MESVSRFLVRVKNISTGDMISDIGEWSFSSEDELKESRAITCGGYNCKEVFRPEFQVLSAVRKAVDARESSFKGGTKCPGSRLGPAHKGQKRRTYPCETGWVWEGTVEYLPVEFRVVSNQLTGNQTIADSLELEGQIVGDAVVESGGVLLLRGQVTGSLTVRSGGKVEVWGTVGGRVVAEEGSEVVYHEGDLVAGA